MNSSKYPSIGELIKEKRKQLKMTQEGLANEIGVTPATISLYESGERKPDIGNIKKIASTLEISMLTLLDIEIPDTDIDLALRAQDLKPSEIEKVKEYIKTVRYARKFEEENK
jgi:transcriptional regulator with XRE-family HTH domain